MEAGRAHNRGRKKSASPEVPAIAELCGELQEARCTLQTRTLFPSTFARQAQRQAAAAKAALLEEQKAVTVVSRKASKG